MINPGLDFSTYPTVDSQGFPVGDMDLSWQPISGTQVIAERVLRRLTCPPGSFDDITWGIDLRTVLNASLTSSDLLSLQGAIESELRREESLSEVEAICLLSSDNKLIVSLQLTTADEESFAFSFQLSTAGVEKILSVSENQNG